MFGTTKNKFLGYSFKNHSISMSSTIHTVLPTTRFCNPTPSLRTSTTTRTITTTIIALQGHRPSQTAASPGKAGSDMQHPSTCGSWSRSSRCYPRRYWKRGGRRSSSKSTWLAAQHQSQRKHQQTAAAHVHSRETASCHLWHHLSHLGGAYRPYPGHRSGSVPFILRPGLARVGVTMLALLHSRLPHGGEGGLCSAGERGGEMCWPLPIAAPRVHIPPDCA